MAEDKVRRIGILTGGGDCPGLNAVIRAVTKTAVLDYGVDVIGIEDGFEGLVEGHMRELGYGDSVLGHLQRGGSPTAFDRILATKYGVTACRLAVERKFGMMAALQGQTIVPVPIKTAIAELKTVAPDNQTVQAARAVGTSFGDE